MSRNNKRPFEYNLNDTADASIQNNSDDNFGGQEFYLDLSISPNPVQTNLDNSDAVAPSVQESSDKNLTDDQVSSCEPLFKYGNCPLVFKKLSKDEIPNQFENSDEGNFLQIVGTYNQTLNRIESVDGHIQQNSISTTINKILRYGQHYAINVLKHPVTPIKSARFHKKDTYLMITNYLDIQEQFPKLVQTNIAGQVCYLEDLSPSINVQNLNRESGNSNDHQAIVNQASDSEKVSQLFLNWKSAWTEEHSTEAPRKKHVSKNVSSSFPQNQNKKNRSAGRTQGTFRGNLVVFKVEVSYQNTEELREKLPNIKRAEPIGTFDKETQSIQCFDLSEKADIYRKYYNAFLSCNKSEDSWFASGDEKYTVLIENFDNYFKSHDMHVIEQEQVSHSEEEKTVAYLCQESGLTFQEIRENLEDQAPKNKNVAKSKTENFDTDTTDSDSDFGREKQPAIQAAPSYVRNPARYPQATALNSIIQNPMSCSFMNPYYSRALLHYGTNSLPLSCYDQQPINVIGAPIGGGYTSSSTLSPRVSLHNSRYGFVNSMGNPSNLPGNSSDDQSQYRLENINRGM